MLIMAAPSMILTVTPDKLSLAVVSLVFKTSRQGRMSDLLPILSLPRLDNEGGIG